MFCIQEDDDKTANEKSERLVREASDASKPAKVIRNSNASTATYFLHRRTANVVDFRNRANRRPPSQAKLSKCQQFLGFCKRDADTIVDRRAQQQTADEMAKALELSQAKNVRSQYESIFISSFGLI